MPFTSDFGPDFGHQSAVYEPIMESMFGLLNDLLIPGVFRYSSRRMITWEAILQQSFPPAFIQPAFILYDGIGFGGGKTKFEQRGRGRPPVRILSRTIVVYAQIPGGGTPGGVDLVTAGGMVFAPLSEAIEAVFQQVDSENALTLGGLVSHCWIDGDSHWLVGDIDPGGQGMMTIPVQIMVP